ncbi:NrdH-like glutaredoxin [Gordonia phage Huffy]|nr:NrdH-like glutaredoxin [Gordonia phage Huffy]AQY55747.1 NrdH-like glutaredoxin [Gordonia phage DinoDaryn]
MIEVFTKPECVQCRMTFRELDRLGIEYAPVDVMADDENYRRAQRYGLTAMPIVDAGGGNVWGGFKPDRIRALVA